MRVLRYAIAIALMAFSAQLFAQQNSVSIGTNQVNPKAVLWLVPNSGGQGLLLPVVSSSVRTGMGLQATDRGMIVYDGTDNAVYLWNGTSWASLAGGGSTAFTGTNGITITGNTISTDAIRPTTSATGDLTGTFANPQIAANAVTTGKIANNAVDDSKIAGVSPSKIAQASATTGQVLKWNGTAWAPADDASAAVTAGTGINITGNVISNTGLLTTTTAGGDLTGTFANLQIASGAITSIELADNAVTTAKIAADAVTTAKILDANVTNTKLAANAVDASKIADGSVTGADLATNIAITTTGNINAANFTGNGSGLTGITATVADGSITGGTAGAGVKLAANTITDANVSPTANIAATKLATSVVLDTESPTGGEVSGNFSTGLTVNSAAITTTKIADGSVTDAKIASGVAVNKLAPGSNGQVLTVSGGIATWQNAPGGTVPTLSNGQILTGDGATNAATTLTGDASLSGGAITIANNAVTTAKIATDAVTTAKILDANVTNAKLAANAVDASKITDGSISGADLANNIAITTTGNIAAANFTGNGSGLTGITVADGSITGGTAGAGVKLAANTITDANISATAGIAGTKLASTVVLDTESPTGGEVSGNFSTGLTINANAVTNTKIATGIDASKITTGVLPVAQVPNLDAAKITTGTLPVARGGTGITAVTPGGIVYGGATDFAFTPAGTAGQFLQSNGAAAPTWTTFTGWSLLGNTGTNPATNFIGTTDAQPAIFRTSNLERMRIDATGNMGIGTTTPGSKLEVAGGITANGGVVRAGTLMGQQTLTQINDPVNGLLGGDGLLSHFAGDTYLRGGWGLAFDRYNQGEVDPSSGNYFGTNPDAGSASFRYWTGSSWRTDMIIRASGNVGVGSLNPLSKLDVNGDVRLAQITAPSTTTDKLYNVGGNLFWNGTNISGGGSGWSLTGNAGTNPATNFMGTTDAQPMVFKTNNLERVRIDENGNVAIGNNAPRSMLELNSLTSDQGMLRLISGSDNVGSTGIMFGRYAVAERNAKTAIMMHQSVNGDWRRGDLVFALNGAPDFSEVSLADEKMRITFGGNVGIGVTNPASKLQLAGDLGLAPMTAPSTTTDKLYNVGGNLFWNGINISGSSGWGLTGNVGTVDGTNFIGTRDNVPLTFRVNDQRAARIEPASATANSFFGYQAGNVNTGNFNAAFGYWAMVANTSGQGIAALGYRALASNTTGSSNTATGFSALAANTTGYANTAVGSEALRFVATGYDNTAVGQQALRNATGNANIAMGSQAAVTLTSGLENAALGAGALFNTTTGSYNTALGTTALSTNTTGSNNTALGYNAEVATGALTNATAIGANAQVASSNSMVLGSISGVNGATANTNVGIGTTTPASRLDVVGDLRLAQITAPGTTTDKLYNVGGSLFWNGTNISAGASSWALSGNAGTVDGTDFIGTTDNIPLTFRVNNQRAGRIESVGTTANSFFGYQAGNVNTGNFNAAFGYLAMATNTSGQGIAALGYRALASNTTGSSNTATGFSALAANTTGYANTALGSEALRFVVTGYDNTAIGQQALRNATGNANIAMGSQAAVTLTSGIENAALGAGALFNTTTGSFNTALGTTSLSTNTTGSNNTALGYNAEVATGALTNATAIGANAQVSASNSLVLGSISGVNSATASTLVGIGITAPTATLDISSNGPFATPQARIYQTNGADYGRLRFGSAATASSWWDVGALLTGTASTEKLNFWNQASGINVLSLSGNGYVGIGTMTPSYPLEVTTSAPFTPTNGGEYLFNGQVGGVNTSRNISIRAANTMLASSFLAVSDKRIKENIKTSNATADLTTLMNLDVVDYDYIDRVRMGGVVQKGFIAQQVKEVYPDAVNVLKSGEFVPSVYAKARNVSKANDVVTIQLAKAHGLQIGDKVQIISEAGEFKELVTAVSGDNTFEVRNASIPSEGLFIYGKEVKDFYTVDYDRIYTLGISAMQELTRKLEAQQQIIDSLKARDVENQKKIAALEARLTQSSSADAELAALKAEIEKIKIAIGVSAEATPDHDKK